MVILFRPYRVLFINAVVFVLLAAGYPSAAHAAFQSQNIEGWTVLIDDDSIKAKDSDLDLRVRAVIKSNLATLSTLLPAKRLIELRRVPIHVWNEEGVVHGAYYANGGGFAEDGTPPTGIIGGVAFANPLAMLDWLQSVPSGILHELTHAYHDQVIGMSDPTIEAAYKNAVDHNLYLNVARVSGEIVPKSYALTNKAEYFALLTQAYFWKSGYYPFTREELRKYDPVGFRAVEEAWLARAGPQPAEHLSLGHGGSCNHIKSAGAAPSRQIKAMITVHNWAQVPVSFQWVQPNGKKVPYKDIAAEGYRSQPTYAGQTWEIDYSNGACLATVMIDKLGNHIDIDP